jgi:hypothetical protein
MVDPSCVLDLSMDEIVGGKVLDKTANHNDGTLVGALHLPTCVAGKIGNGILFDGTEDKITIADSASVKLTTTLTLMAWIKPSIINVATAIFDRLNATTGYALYVKNATIQADAQTDATNTTVVTGNVLTAGEWIHIAYTLSASAEIIYINGVLSKSEVPSTTAKTNAITLRIGEDNFVSGLFFTGVIDEVRAYNRVLPIAEIRRIYDTGLNGHQNSIPAMTKGVPTW